MPEADQIEKALQKSKTWKWLRTVLTILMLPLLGWLGREALKTYSEANNKAIWDAIAENKNEAARHREDIRVMQRLFDREFGRSSGSKAAEPLRWEEPKPAPMDPDKLRTIMEQKYPSKK
jgi:hypothetical protein